MIKTEQGVWTNLVENRLPYILEAPPAGLNILAREKALEHVSKILYNRGVCYLYGGKGVGKTLLGAEISLRYVKFGCHVKWFTLSNQRKTGHDFVWSNLINNYADDLVGLRRKSEPIKKKHLIDLMTRQIGNHEVNLWVIDNLSISAKGIGRYINQFLTDKTKTHLQILYLGTLSLGNKYSSVLLRGFNLEETRSYAELKMGQKVEASLGQILFRVTSGIPILIDNLLPPKNISNSDIEKYVENSLIPGHSPRVMRYFDSIIQKLTENQIQRVRKIIKQGHRLPLSSHINSKPNQSLFESGILYRNESGYFVPLLSSAYLTWMLG